MHDHLIYNVTRLIYAAPIVPVSVLLSLFGRLYFITYGNVIISQLEVYFSASGAFTAKFQLCLYLRHLGLLKFYLMRQFLGM